MIIYVGDKLSGGFVKEVAERSDFNHEVVFIEPKAHISELVDDITLAAANGGCKYIVYEVDYFIDNADVIANTIQSIRNTNGADPILIVPSINPNNMIVSAAHDRGFTNFINSGATMSDKKSELIRCISGYYDANGRAELKEIEKVKAEKAKRKNAFRTIGIMGTCHRIGTTTQALQIVKYLQSKGYKACYVEMNNYLYPNMQLSRKERPEITFVNKAKLAMDYDYEDEALGLVTIEGVDMYYKQDRLPEILEKDYDFYIYDYGVYTERDFNKASYLKDDTKLIASGTNVVELDYTLNIMQNVSYNSSDLIFSFTAEKDREEFVLWMQHFKAGERCYFADYTPNPFILSNYELYDGIFSLDQKVDPAAEPEKEKKRGLFGKKKKK